MAEQAIRVGWWAALLFATALPGAQAQLPPLMRARKARLRLTLDGSA